MGFYICEGTTSCKEDACKKPEGTIVCCRDSCNQSVQDYRLEDKATKKERILKKVHEAKAEGKHSEVKKTAAYLCFTSVEEKLKISKAESNFEFVKRKRDDVTFSPNDQQYAETFMQREKRNTNAPYTQYYQSIIDKALGTKQKK